MRKLGTLWEYSLESFSARIWWLSRFFSTQLLTCSEWLACRFNSGGNPKRFLDAFKQPFCLFGIYRKIQFGKWKSEICWSYVAFRKYMTFRGLWQSRDTDTVEIWKCGQPTTWEKLRHLKVLSIIWWFQVNIIGCSWDWVGQTDLKWRMMGLKNGHKSIWRWPVYS